MSALAETYCGGVIIQECDAFGHLNIAYYVERFGDAAFELMRRLAPGTRWRTTAINTRYLTELRAGDPIVIASGIIAIDAATLTIGHVATSGEGEEPSTTAEQTLALDAPDGEAWAELRAVLDASRAVWTQPRFDPVALPERARLITTTLNRVKSWEADEAGQLSLFGFVDRFSTANIINMNNAGMTSTYMRSEKRGFATFETRLDLFVPTPRVGEGVATVSGLLDLGKSSVKILHEMRLVEADRRVARFYQAGVHFDLEARRSTPLPDALRAKAQALLIARAP